MPFSRSQASLDTNILRYFFAAGRIDLIWALFPDGIWIDPSVLYELRSEFGDALAANLERDGFPFQVERQFEDHHYVQMAEIKARHRALKHPDIVTVVVAEKQDATCLSADDVVRKICEERGIPFARHLGCLDEAVSRELLGPADAVGLMEEFLEGGLYLPGFMVERYRRKWER